jgi:hypothetical protein
MPLTSERRAARVTRRLTGLFAAALALLPAPARADALDPTMPRVLVVGPPRGDAPSERLDAQRTGRTRTRLPFPLVEVWRRHLTGGIEQPPVIDAQDNILAALTVPEVVKLAPDGKELWRARLGNAAPVVPPALTSDGTLVAVTSAGLAWGLSPSGSVRFTTPLGVRGRDVDVAPLALRDGGLVVAAGSTLLELDRDGGIRARTSLDQRPGSVDSRVTGALLEGPSGDGKAPAFTGTLFTTESGSVFLWRPPGAPRRLGSFGGLPRRGALLADGRTLVAVVDTRRVVGLDLLTGTTQVRATGFPGALFDSPAALAPEQIDRGPLASLGPGVALVTVQFGLLLGLDGAGNERVRISLDKPPPPPVAGVLGGLVGGTGGSSFFAPAEFKPSPPLIVDAQGRIAFARANGRVGVVGPDGAISLAGERVCLTPVAVVPAGEKRMVLACRDGGLWLYGE